MLSIVSPKVTAEEAKLLSSAKEKIFQARIKRVRPHLDDKILASCNGMMLGAMARAAAVLKDATSLNSDEQNLK